MVPAKSLWLTTEFKGPKIKPVETEKAVAILPFNIAVVIVVK